MAAINDIIQLVVRGTYLGELWTNVFHYKVNTLGGTLTATAGVNDAFMADVMADWRNLINSAVLFTDLYTVNLGDPADMTTTVVGAAGNVAATAAQRLPSYIALAFKYNRTNALYHNGWKRICGCYDDMTTGNTWSGNTTDANALATAFSTTLVPPADPLWSFQPFIARRPIAYGVNPAGYPTNLCNFIGITTQNSRKP